METKKIIVSDKIGKMFLKAETNQSKMEEVANRMGHEMPLSKFLNEHIKKNKLSSKVILDKYGNQITK